MTDLKPPTFPRGSRVRHRRHGLGTVVGRAVCASAVLVHFDGRPDGTAKVARRADLVPADLPEAGHFDEVERRALRRIGAK